MNNEKIPLSGMIPKVGSEYLKLKTGDFVKWKSFDEKTQLFEINPPIEGISKFHRRDVEIPTANEVAVFLAAKREF